MKMCKVYNNVQKGLGKLTLAFSFNKLTTLHVICGRRTTYLSQVEDVGGSDLLECVDSSSEGVDLLVRIPH